MFKYLSKIELKHSFNYYLFLLLFFFFWNFFSLFLIYFYFNIQNILKIHQKGISIDLLIFDGNNSKTINTLFSQIKDLSYVKNVSIISPRELLKKVKKDLPPEILKGLSEKEINSYFPYILRIYPALIKDYPTLKNQLQILTKPYKNIEMFEHKFFNLIYMVFFLKLGFVWFVIIWSFFYLIFLYLINNLLNIYLNEQTKIFLLLGGTLEKIILLRFLFIFLILLIGFVTSYLLFSYLANNLTIIFPFFEIYPDFAQREQILYFIGYIFLILFFLPFIVVLLSYKKYEI